MNVDNVLRMTCVSSGEAKVRTVSATESKRMSTELLERILPDENLEEARHKVMSNKGSAGIDRMPVSRLPEYISEHKEEMKEMIRQRRYRPLPVKRV